MTLNDKLNARTVTIDGITFRSTLEGKRYKQLKLMVQSGDIRDLELQPVYPIIITSLTDETKLCGRYHADFRYYDILLGQTIIEDVKGKMTEAAALRIKIVQQLYGIEIVLVRKEDI